MSDGRASGRAAETAVGNQGYSGSETHTCDGGGRVQHLSHARAALRSLVADDNHVACHDLAALDGCDGILFTVEDAGRSLMNHHFRYHCGALNHASIRSQVTLQDSDAADLTVGILNRSDHLRIAVDARPDVLADGLASDGNQFCIQQVLLI